MKTFLRLLAMMRPEAGWMAAAIGLAAVASLAHVALMATSGWFITAMALAGLAGGTINYFTPAALIRAFAITRTGARYGERLIGHEATLRFVASLRPHLFVALERGAPASIEGLRQGDVLARLKGDVDRLEFAFLRVVAPLAVASVVVAVGLAWVLTYSAAIATVLLATIVVAGVLLPLAVGSATRRRSERLGERAALFNARTAEALDGMAELAVYDPARWHRHAVLEASDAALRNDRELAEASALAGALVIAMANLTLVLLLVVGLPLVADEALEPADLPMLVLMAVALFEAVAPVPLAFQNLPVVIAAATRVFELADRPPAADEPARPAASPEGAGLHLSGVGYSYPGAWVPALDGIALAAPAGSRIAIIGASGSGKSTLAELLVRFRDPSSGEIRLGEQSYRDLRAVDVRRSIVLMAQDDHLFSATIRDNLLVADPDADEAALRQSSTVAGILTFIEAQPEGFDTFVGAQGTKLSGGERRRLLVARAWLAAAKVRILDEPTEGLDAETEARLLDALIDGDPAATLIVITHRPARLTRMDLVLRIEAGRIVAAGSPSDMQSQFARLSWLR